MELTPDQIIIVSGVATVFVWFLTFVWSGLFKQPKPSANVLKALVLIAATALAYFWTPFELPDPGIDIWAFIGSLLSVAAAVFASSKIIYDLIWKRLMEGLDKLLGIKRIEGFFLARRKP